MVGSIGGALGAGGPKPFCRRILAKICVLLLTYFALFQVVLEICNLFYKSFFDVIRLGCCYREFFWIVLHALSMFQRLRQILIVFKRKIC